MTNCKFCTGTTDIKSADDIVTHINIRHTKVPGDELATSKNIDRLIREVAKCWHGHDG
jgi:hypothetical protein